ncbi:hypothetical protein IQ06DRAFT_355768 [Phaeosphaeriaceae sp. SRC1lsM3a]|nr:hypothetical protein IQ06DRAFT_355768 [Stagonospora sp. SRC1lsM3a]
MGDDSTDCYDFCASSIQGTYEWNGTVFLTSEGRIGIYSRENESEDNGGSLFAAVLFGIQLPFILKDVGSGHYKLWALAHIGDHKLGGEHVEAMGPDGDWRDLVVQGKMEEFVLVWNGGQRRLCSEVVVSVSMSTPQLQKRQTN